MCKIINTNQIPSDQKTRNIIINALEVAHSEATKEKDINDYKAVLLALKSTQETLPF